MAAILPPPIAAACNVQMFILQPLNLNRFDFLVQLTAGLRVANGL